MAENDVTAVPAEGQPAPKEKRHRVVLPEVQREYHQFYRTPSFRWWRPLVALVAFVVVFYVGSQVLVKVGLFLSGVPADAIDRGEYATDTPSFVLANNVVMASLILFVWAAHRVFFRQKIGWLSSVEGRFRWGAFWRFAGLSAPLIAVALGVQGKFQDLQLLPETWLLLAITLLLTPLQSAGEEFLFRGFAARAIGSWFPSRRIGLIVATVVTTVIFMLVHGAGDPWLNAFYVVLGLCASLLVWRTGGLEGAIALHVVNNVGNMLVVSFVGTEGMFDREAGVSDAWTLLNMAAVIGSTALILWQAKRLGLRSRSAPAAVEASND